jgi:hypothetical protein
LNLYPSCIKITFESILVAPMARDILLTMARRRYKIRLMVEWSEDHVAAIGSLNLNFGINGRIGLN